ncbi:uncharacterized protein EDB93DRAFT_1331612 [Suillus bovinus]|uniref:uncharacterized protein n=1 Tax=Suillus bovinus TaxID=48563 RepID=UPI001B87046D|nr:uncharacterized protein EDB93DRAFT_1331612 [Suillus bovinus]KAG2132691.1 hypothetical protein EDB93DRAFT_1331612 [Suillus bovinus]
MSEDTPTVVASSDPLHISSIAFRLDDASKKKIDSAELKLDSQLQKIHHSSEQDKNLSAKFDPAITVTTEQVSLSVHCYHTIMGVLPRKTTTNFSLNRKDILAQTVDPNGQREYSTSKRNMAVIITTTSQLQSTSSDILKICPRFRLLVIGNTGVGKSTLIHQAFKVKEVHAAEYERGEADIHKEYTAPENERFVVHDSLGFEAGSSKNLAMAKDFINSRRSMPLKDQVHAVWLCISIPLSNEALLENGVEEFLKLRKEILGDIPIIVVFTKYDALVDKLEYDASKSDDYDEAALESLKVNKLDELCIQPLKEVAGSNILHTTVSTEEEHESTVRQLIDLTTTNVETFVASEAALVMMIAQGADIGLKVKASIAIGKKRYWRGLVASVNFIGFTMLECLSVIHKDIIDVWNFNDPYRYLASDQFKGLILNHLDKADDEPTPKDLDNLEDDELMDKADLPHTAQAFFSSEFSLATITAVLTLLAGVLPPIAAVVALVEWARDAYKDANIVSQRIMTYIVDLTCVMQILFLLVPTGPISRHVIKIAIKAYEGTYKNQIHLAIQSHCVSAIRRGEDDALEKIVKLIEDHSIKAEEVRGLRARIGPVDLKADEEW